MCAATGGMIGYVLEQETGNILGYDVPVTTILTRIVVSVHDPEFIDPSKFVGPVLDKAGVDKLAAAHGWQFKRDGTTWRRVVPSPFPERILWHRPIRWLLEQNAVVICNGGGGIPVVAQPDGSMKGVEAVIDKDRASGLLATHIPADLLVLATDVDGVYADFGTAQLRRLPTLYSAEIDEAGFAAGSMGPKIAAARAFADATGTPAVTAALDQAALPHLHRSYLLRDVLKPAQDGASAQPAFAQLARGIHRHCQASLRRGTGELAGLGQGLTPAGDDFLCGLMLALNVAHPAPSILCQTITAQALRATTTLLGAFLRAAAAGHAMPQWHRLLAEGASPSAQGVADILRYGHSSGGDSLAGFLWGARNL
ncbi:DUF2877 domain-containing protein [Roseinatronobacter sp. S2]|uniref:oxamate carbamoyltransferase subunit AllH family protein n=1 Tax=Roseinatronobacter sp. S2 TaxID=3035471 RepID=UPI00240EFABF|nr:DUF2877 domain-containing protein [Roseinatronobacter sp. S2]WFE76614.1 DUF2877 domain-containing protein [Roseinatronobacter sp. S2]